MDMKLYFGLSFAMFLEYAIWGAWAPVLAARLLGPLKMSGKQTGWIYATLPLACIISPLVSGQLADEYMNTEHILAAAHLIGAVLLFVAVRQTKFKNLFVVMLAYNLCYGATLPLVNAVLFAKVADVGNQGKVFIWAPVAWSLVGYALTGWRWKFKTGEEGKDCLYFAAILSVIMAVGCLTLVPEIMPAKTGEMPILKAIGMLKNTDFLVFMAIQLLVFGMMQFYFLGTAPFMQDMGIAAKNVPGSMAVAQVVQAVATWFLLGLFLEKVGTKWTLTIGAACWTLMYGAYVLGKPRALIIGCQGLHGFAYVFFVIVGQIYAAQIAPEAIRGSMQALIFAVTTGLSLFLGTQFAGIVMDKFKKEGRFQWGTIFMVPGAITLLGVLILALLFKVKAS